jgi:hypothetical protein
MDEYAKEWLVRECDIYNIHSNYDDKDDGGRDDELN